MTRIRNLTIFYFVLAVLFTSCHPTAWQNVMIYNNEQGLGPCEPSIVINPANQDNIVAGSVLNNVHVSMDGGKTWKTEELKSTLGVYGDPCLIASPEGRLHYFHLADPDGRNWQSPRILECIVGQWSDDGGVTWSSGSAIGTNPPKQQDKEWAIIDPNNGNIYITWTEFDKYGSKEESCKSRIRFSKSIDQGLTWSKAISITTIEGDCIDDDQTCEGAVPAVDQDGNIYVTWSYDEQLFFSRSLDGGENWTDADKPIFAHPGGWDIEVEGIGRANGMPVTCSRLNQKQNRDEILINWVDSRNGKNEVFVAKSINGGDTWSEPTLISDSLLHGSAFFTWMTVDPTSNYVYVIYYQYSGQHADEIDVILASSKDGTNFKRLKISEKPFAAPPKSVFFGDYNNISAYNGSIRPIWTVFSDDKLSVWTALINEKRLFRALKNH